ncbi:methyltransferase domain-containing protein [Streptomyces sp. NPDC000594]|uniref:class I SAM-dependent methyltransferase n=1 Tax=Streptomyces sp. NPDC000594 TaxID=3154261 RepID=UPI00331B2930
MDVAQQNALRAQAQPGVQWYYEQYAEALAERYEGLSFPELYEEVLPHLPVPPARAADIGAGSGRDAAALARMGWRVTAVEPVRALRETAARLHPEDVRWLADSLPELSGVDGPFELLLLSAVWMHLDHDERPVAMERLSGLLTGGGRLVITLRHGEPPRDRRMFDVPVGETVGLAAAQGLTLLHRSGGEDRLGRDGVHWSRLVFEKAPEPDGETAGEPAERQG